VVVGGRDGRGVRGGVGYTSGKFVFTRSFRSFCTGYQSISRY